jgi:hypothetical protein
MAEAGDRPDETGRALSRTALEVVERHIGHAETTATLRTTADPSVDQDQRRPAAAVTD